MRGDDTIGTQIAVLTAGAGFIAVLKDDKERVRPLENLRARVPNGGTEKHLSLATIALNHRFVSLADRRVYLLVPCQMLEDILVMSVG